MNEANIKEVINTAKEQIGKPYKYGARPEDAPDFFDCSSFVQWVFKQVGVSLPRTCLEQAEVGREVPLEDIQPGDVVFLKGEIGRYNKSFPDGVGHAGIYIGDNKIIHAERDRVVNDLYDPSKIKEAGDVRSEELKSLIKRKKLVIIRRYFGNGEE